MSLIPSPHRLQVKRYVASVKDEMGDTTTTYADPVEWWVRSVDPVSSREPNQPNRDMANIAYVVQADKTSAVPTYRDIVVVDGTDYPVDGQPDDWTRGPWANPAAGVSVYLRRVEG